MHPDPVFYKEKATRLELEEMEQKQLNYLKRN